MNFGQRSTAQALAFSLRSPRAAGDETALYYSRQASKSPSSAHGAGAAAGGVGGALRRLEARLAVPFPGPTNLKRCEQTGAENWAKRFKMIVQNNTSRGGSQRVLGQPATVTTESGHVYERWRRGKKAFPGGTGWRGPTANVTPYSGSYGTSIRAFAGKGLRTTKLSKVKERSPKLPRKVTLVRLGKAMLVSWEACRTTRQAPPWPCGHRSRRAPSTFRSSVVASRSGRGPSRGRRRVIFAPAAGRGWRLLSPFRAASSGSGPARRRA